MQGSKSNEWGDQIVPFPIQSKNNAENVCLRKEIPVYSSESREFAQPLIRNMAAVIMTFFWAVESLVDRWRGK